MTLPQHFSTCNFKSSCKIRETKNGRVSLLCKKMYIKVVLFIYKFVFYIKRYLARVITAGQLTLRSSSQRVQSPTQHLTAPNTPYMPCAHNSHTAPHSSQYPHSTIRRGFHTHGTVLLVFIHFDAPPRWGLMIPLFHFLGRNRALLETSLPC